MSSLPFVHLRVHSAYSLLQGAIHVKPLVGLCKDYDMPAVAVTDFDNLFGSLEFSQAATGGGVQPIIGCTLSVAPHKAEAGKVLRRHEYDQLLLIAKNETGYHNLLELVSDAYLQPELDDAPLVSYDEVLRLNEGLICLTAGIYGGVGKALLNSRQADAVELITKLKDGFGDRLYVELMRHGLSDEKRLEPKMVALAIEQDVPLVATNDCYFADSDMYEAHDALLCVADGRYVSEDERRRLTPEHRFKSQKEMRLLFGDIPEALENTARIAQRCSVFAPARSPILPGFHVQDEQGNVLTESDALIKRAEEGLQARLEAHVFTDDMDEAKREEVAKPYFERLEYELDVIITMKFPGYFLIVSDFITWAKEHDIPVGPGRGSGAGSLVAWSLLITDLDPLRFGLIFERFLNPERVSMPDFDIDFCQERRDEVIRYVQRKYGTDKVAQIITFGKLQARAVLRDVGRVLQMPYGQVDKICKLVPANPANPVTLQEALELETQLRRAREEDEMVDKLITLSLKLEGLYRHASTHAAGVVIADRPLHELIALYRDPKSDMPVVQYSMKYAEAAGLVKFDFLGLKTLTVINKALKLLTKRSINVDIDHLPEGDAVTYELLSKGNTIGVFQFESAGMQDALRKLQPDRLEDLIALGALYRPGPMDNIPSYIARKHGKEEPDYLHPMLEEVLRETYGVIIYQEQVQKIAQVMAGYSLGAADLLRRAMGKKIKEEMDAQREMFAKGAKENNVDEKQASHIFDLVAKFAGYGFNKSHAAAYAVIAYQTAYLKANYPAEFIAASMTYDMHSTEKLGTFRQEAMKFDIETLPPCINHSKVYFDTEDVAGEEGVLAIRYALAAIKNVGAQAVQDIVDEREANGPYKDVYDFANRVSAHTLNRRLLEHLVMAGAFDALHPNRRQLYESIDMILGLNSDATRERESDQVSLFGDASEETLSKPPLAPVDDWTGLDRLQYEFNAIGFYLSSHPLEAYAQVLEQERFVSSVNLEGFLGEKYAPVKVAGVVTGRKNKLSPKGRFAFVQLSDTTGIYEVSVFDEDILNNYSDLLEPGQIVLLRCDGKRDDGGARLIVQSVENLREKNLSVRTNSITLHISNPDEAAAKLKDMLPEPQEKGTQICMLVPVKQGLAKLQLKGRFEISPELIADVKAVGGVDECEVA